MLKALRRLLCRHVWTDMFDEEGEAIEVCLKCESVNWLDV